MKVGTITKPIRFRNEEGKWALRILFYSQYTPPHYANLKDDYQKIYLAALNEKQDEILYNWLKSAKSEVFIEIDPEYDECNVLDQL